MGAPVIRYLILVATVATIAAGPLRGQEAGLHLGAGPVYARASGSLAQYVGDGFGAGAQVALLGRGRWVGVRIGADFVRFAPATRFRPYRLNAPAVIATGSAILSATVGPQVQLSARRLRVTATAGAGFARLTSTGSVSVGTLARLNRSTTFDDLTYALAGDGGLGVVVRSGPVPLWLELSARYVRLGPSRWVREGNLPVGTVSGVYLNPTWSTSAQWVYRISFVVGAAN